MSQVHSHEEKLKWLNEHSKHRDDKLIVLGGQLTGMALNFVQVQCDVLELKDIKDRASAASCSSRSSVPLPS